jgi:hypothetical protein
MAPFMAPMVACKECRLKATQLLMLYLQPQENKDSKIMDGDKKENQNQQLQSKKDLRMEKRQQKKQANQELDQLLLLQRLTLCTLASCRWNVQQVTPSLKWDWAQKEISDQPLPQEAKCQPQLQATQSVIRTWSQAIKPASHLLT